MRVVRFGNDEIVNDVSTVVEKIREIVIKVDICIENHPPLNQ